MDRRKVVEIAEGWDKLGLRLGLASGNNTVTESRVCARRGNESAPKIINNAINLFLNCNRHLANFKQ